MDLEARLRALKLCLEIVILIIGGYAIFSNLDMTRAVKQTQFDAAVKYAELLDLVSAQSTRLDSIATTCAIRNEGE